MIKIKVIKNALFLGFIFLSLVSYKGQAQKQLNDSLQKLRSDVSIAGKKGGEITKDELLNSKGLETSSQDHTISGFTINIFVSEKSMIGKGSSMSATTFSAGGCELTKQMKDAIRNLPSGSQVEFLDIHCTPKYKVWHFVDPFTFTLK